MRALQGDNLRRKIGRMRFMQCEEKCEEFVIENTMSWYGKRAGEENRGE